MCFIPAAGIASRSEDHHSAAERSQNPDSVISQCTRVYIYASDVMV